MFISSFIDRFISIYLLAGNKEDCAIIKDVLLYASHPDPQLKGNCSLIIGNLLSAVLKESRGKFDRWVKQNGLQAGWFWLQKL